MQEKSNPSGSRPLHEDLLSQCSSTAQSARRKNGSRPLYGGLLSQLGCVKAFYEGTQARVLVPSTGVSYLND